MVRSGRILVVDDEVGARVAVANALRASGFDVETAADATKALGKAAAFAPDIVVSDLEIADADGLELVKKLRAPPEPPTVIVTTAFGAIGIAVDALRAGAAEYLTTPINLDELAVMVDKHMSYRDLEREVRQLRARTSATRARIVGAVPAMLRAAELVDHAAASRVPVLVTGEIGTGKRLVASLIHQRSDRAARPLVRLPCAGLTEARLASELAHARGGTLVLDAIAEMTPAVQAQVLRQLDSKGVAVAVRLVAATHRDLIEALASGALRGDLYDRLNALPIDLPPLRDRKTDLPALANHFVDRRAGRRTGGKATARMSAAALDAIAAYDWPGNVRELEQAIERAIVLAGGGAIEPSHLPGSVRAEPVLAKPAVPGATLAEIERHAILATLRATNGSTTRAAQILGISVRTVQYRLQDYSATLGKTLVAPHDALTAPGSARPRLAAGRRR